MKIWSFVPVCHLFTVCGGMALALSNTSNEVAVGEKILFCANLHGKDNYMVQLSGTPDISIAAWTIQTSVILQNIHPKYEGRVQWNINGSLNLDNVQINDSGKYIIEINFLNVDANGIQKYFELSVFEPVAQPAVKITDDCSTPNITLSCLVSSGTNVTFHWRKQSLHGATDDIYNGSELVINRGIEGEQHMYICLAENAVSNATSDPVEPKKCSKGTLLWMILFGLIPVALIAGVSINSTKEGGETRELNEQTVVFTSELIEPTYITTLKPEMSNHSSEEQAYIGQ